MRLKLALLTTALAFGFGVPAALAEDAPGATNDITIAGAPAEDSAGKMQKDESQNAPDQGAPATEEDGGAALQQAPSKSDEDAQ
jgi:hypothetical protein